MAASPGRSDDDCPRCRGTGAVSVYVGGETGAIKCPACTTPADFDRPAWERDA